MTPTNPTFDLRTLPKWLQCAILTTVVGGIVVLAWLTGRHRPVPPWILRYLVPALGWSYLVAVGAVIVRRLRRR